MKWTRTIKGWRGVASPILAYEIEHIGPWYWATVIRGPRGNRVRQSFAACQSCEMAKIIAMEHQAGLFIRPSQRARS